MGCRRSSESSVMYQGMGDTQRVLGCRPRGLPEPTYLIPGLGRRCFMISVPWSSMSGKITHLCPEVRTHSVLSSCQQAFGAGYANRRYDALGFLLGSTRATPASRKIRASDAVDSTGVMPNERIFSER